jgi:hypothetical protein
MNKDANKMSCEAFQAQLPELIGSGENVNAHPHLENCELCLALLADLETIAEAARQLFPIEEPPDDLWEHIESAIKNEKATQDEDGPPTSINGHELPEPE